MANEYSVAWYIDSIEADTPLQAAEICLKIHRDPASIATHFVVTGATGDQTRVDLMGVDLMEEPEPDHGKQGVTCPKCGGHSFKIQATFAGDVSVTFDATGDDPTSFEVYDSNPTDSEWDGPCSCADCGWDGDLGDLLPPAARFECQNCGKLWPEGQLVNPIPHLTERVAAGEPMPAGECPECGALCHQHEADDDEG